MARNHQVGKVSALVNAMKRDDLESLQREFDALGVLEHRHCSPEDYQVLQQLAEELSARILRRPPGTLGELLSCTTMLEFLSSHWGVPFRKPRLMPPDDDLAVAE